MIRVYISTIKYLWQWLNRMLRKFVNRFFFVKNTGKWSTDEKHKQKFIATQFNGFMSFEIVYKLIEKTNQQPIIMLKQISRVIGTTLNLMAC